MKTLFSTLTGIIILIILGAAVIGFITWSRVPDMVANNLSRKLKVSVAIDDMSLGWGKIEIDKVTIGNPPNSVLPKAFSCGYIDVLAPFTRYLDQNIVIDQIDLNNVYLGLEFDSATGTDGNWTRIMGNLNASKEPQSDRQSEKASPKRSVLIHRLILTNIDVEVVYRKEGGKVQKLKRIDRIELTDVSSEGGLPMDQVMNSVLGQMLKSVFEKQNLKNMLQEVLKQQKGLEKYIEPFQGLFNTRYDEEQQPEAVT